MADIYKVTGICIREKKVLVVRSHKHQFFFGLGGKREAGETDEQCLYREVLEESGCQLISAVPYKTFEGSNFDNTKSMYMPTFLIDLRGEPQPNNEIAECRWVGRDFTSQPLGNMLINHVFPELVKDGLI